MNLPLQPLLSESAGSPQRVVSEDRACSGAVLVLEPRFLGVVRAKLRTEVTAVRCPPSLDVASAQNSQRVGRTVKYLLLVSIGFLYRVKRTGL
jgi:hypothetical protein